MALPLVFALRRYSAKLGEPSLWFLISLMESLNELKPGRFLGRYELLAPIAQGGMAAVWAARLRGTRGFQKVVAIKTILPTLSDDPRFESMFLDEASLAARIRHSNVVQVLDLGEDEGLLYQVMEWVDGQPLSALVRDAPGGRGLPHAIAVRILIAVCEGLHAAHEMRDDAGNPVELVHRDVSPQNILVSLDGVPKVVDFGVAKATTLSSVRTAADTFKGKPAYMAPEQILGTDVDRRADIFALGVVLYLATTGKHPFRGETDMATLHRICESEPPDPPSKVYSGYPRALEEVVMRAIEKDASKRFPTAADMARALKVAMPDAQETGDTEVAVCVRQLNSAHLRARSEALKRALVDADARAAKGPAIKQLSPSAGESAPERDEDTAIDLASPKKQSSISDWQLSQSFAGTPATPKEGASRRTLISASIAGIGVVILAITLFAVARRDSPVVSVTTALSAGVPSATVVATALTMAADALAADSAPPNPASMPETPPEAVPKVPLVQPSSAATTTGRIVTRSSDAGVGSGPPETTSTSKPVRHGGGHVPSIRDPGF